MELSKKALWKAVKEPLRLLVLSIIPFALAYLKTISYEWAAVLIAVLRFVDKLLHQLGKEKSDKRLVRGLTRF